MNPRNPAWMLFGFLLSFVPAAFAYLCFDEMMKSLFSPQGDIVTWLFLFVAKAAVFLGMLLLSGLLPIVALYLIGQIRLEEAREELGVSVREQKGLDPGVIQAIGLGVMVASYRYLHGPFSKCGVLIGGSVFLLGFVHNLVIIFAPKSQLRLDRSE